MLAGVAARKAERQTNPSAVGHERGGEFVSGVGNRLLPCSAGEPAPKAVNRNLDRRRGDQRPGRGIGQEAEIAGQQGAAEGQGRRRVEEEGPIASAIRSANRFGGRAWRRIRSGVDRYTRLGPGKRQRAILDLQTRQTRRPDP